MSKQPKTAENSQMAGSDTLDRSNSNAKLEQLERFREDATGEALTTNTGTRIAEARQLCPEIRLIAQRPRLYIDYSRQLRAIIESGQHPAEDVEKRFRLLTTGQRPVQARAPPAVPSMVAVLAVGHLSAKTTFLPS